MHLLPKCIKMFQYYLYIQKLDKKLLIYEKALIYIFQSDLVWQMQLMIIIG